MNANLFKRMNSQMNTSDNSSQVKTPNKPKKQLKPVKQQKSKVQPKPKAKPTNEPKATTNLNKGQNPLHITKTETHSAHVTSNNKTGHMLPWSVQLDVHQIAQLSALEKLLHLKNRSQVEAILLNHRVTVSDIVSKQGKNAKVLFKTFYNSFIFSNKPKAVKQYKKYHHIK